MLAVALSATLAGAQSFVAIAEWAADAAPEVLARLGRRRRCGAVGVDDPPLPATPGPRQAG